MARKYKSPAKIGWRLMTKWVKRDNEKETPSEGSERLADYARLRNLCAELIGVNTPDMEIDRARGTDGRVNYLENSPETYGRSLRQTRQKYMGDVLACHVGKNDCDQEMDEVSRVVVSAAGHGDDTEKMEKPL